MIKELHLVHHPDALGQTPLGKAAGKGQPSQTGNRLSSPALLGQVVKVYAGILNAFCGEIVIVVTINDVSLNTRIQDTGPALQILVKGQRELVNIGNVRIVIIAPAAAPT